MSFCKTPEIAYAQRENQVQLIDAIERINLHDVYRYLGRPVLSLDQAIEAVNSLRDVLDEIEDAILEEKRRVRRNLPDSMVYI